jgi:hypothetical protein
VITTWNHRRRFDDESGLRRFTLERQNVRGSAQYASSKFANVSRAANFFSAMKPRHKG